MSKDFLSVSELINFTAALSGKEVQVKLEKDIMRGVLHMVYLSLDGNSIVFDFLWLAKINFEDKNLVEGKQNVEIAVPAVSAQIEKGLTYEKATRIHILGRLKEERLVVNLYTSILNRTKDDVRSWL